MNSPPIKQAVSTRTPEETTYLDWLQRTCHPVLLGARNLVNALAQASVESLVASATLDPKTDVALVSAALGPVTVTLAPAQLWERRVIIIKTDATANAVTISGVVTALALSVQYAAAEVASDGDFYYPVGASAALAGDVTGAIWANTVVKLQNRALVSTAPAIYQLIRSLDGSTWAPAYEGYPEASGSVTFSLGAGSVDAVAFTVPASPTGIGRFVLQRVLVRLTTALGGADTGTVAVRVGSTVGGNEFNTDQTVNNATPAGTILTLSAATRGASILVANLYEASLAAGATVNLRATTTGTITAGSATAYVYGAFLP
jgi:hypothetical protein